MLSSVISLFKRNDLVKNKLSESIYSKEKYNELELYIREKPIEGGYNYNIIDYWSKQRNTSLKRMALDILSTPGSSCAVERMFSIAKKDDSPLRQSLNEYKKGKMQILKSYWNFQKDIIIENN